MSLIWYLRSDICYFFDIWKKHICLGAIYVIILRMSVDVNYLVIPIS